MKTNPVIRIDPKTIPTVERNLLCDAILEAVIRFYEKPENRAAFEMWRTEKGECSYGSKNG